jgi:protease I
MKIWNLVIGICLVIGIWLLGFGVDGAEAAGKRAVMIVAAYGYQDNEYLIPRQVLEQGGVEVKVASSSLDEAVGMLGGKVQPDLLISEIDPADFDAVLFVGGDGSSEYFKDEDALELVKEANKQKKVLAAICIAPEVFAQAGILRGIRATSSPYSRLTLRRYRARYTGRAVEVSGRIITASGPGASEEFGRAVLKALSE